METTFKPLLSLKGPLEESLINTERAITLLISSFGASEDQYGNILVSLTEAITNAIEHGNQFDSAKQVKVSYADTHHNLIFKIEDEGKGFNPDELPNPIFLENIEMERGRGVFLIRNLADDVSFQNNGSTVLISFSKEKLLNA